MTVENTLATRPRGYVVDIKSLAEAMEYAKVLANTDMVPDGDKGRPGNLLAKMQIGAEIGLPPMQAINTLYVTKGRVGMEVKAMLALVQASGLLEDKVIDTEPDGTVVVSVQRRGMPRPRVVRFGPKEAAQAGLTKDTYQKWSWRMYYNRAMGFALQDEFQDVLRGTVSTDYLIDSGERVAVTDVPADIDGRRVPAALVESDATLEAAAVEKMVKLGLRPGLRLAKLTEYRGRHEALIEWCDRELAAAPAKEAVPEPMPVAPVESDADLDREILAMDMSGALR